METIGQDLRTMTRTPLHSDEAEDEAKACHFMPDRPVVIFDKSAIETRQLPLWRN